MACRATERPPDVLLVVLDTVRADRLASYGHARPTGRGLRALFEATGVLFEDVTAPASWTWPSHASLFTGEYPWVHGADYATDEAGALERWGLAVTPMSPDLPTLAERFAAGGYRTVSLAGNAWLDPELGLVRGFEQARTFDDERALVRAAKDVMEGDDDRPLLLFLNFTQAHGPYTERPFPWVEPHRVSLHPASAPAWLRPYLQAGELRSVDLAIRADGAPLNGYQRYLAGSLEIPAEGFELLLALYDGEVAHSDLLFRAALEHWIDGRAERSIVAVTSDHGEAFGEHGLIEHGGHLYPEVLRVPLVLAAPGRLPAGVRVREPVQMHDLHATLLDLAGIESPPGSLVPIVGGAKRRGPILASATPRRDWARAAGGRLAESWRYYRSGDHAIVSRSDGSLELYDVARDPTMTRDLAVDDPGLASALAREAEPHFRAKASPRERAPLRPSPRALERLRALGYAQ
jgi:arylsulfatase A-like enzyme